MKEKRVNHELEPIYDQDSKILILGTMPSPKSREVGFYYGHPANRFWKVMEMIFEVSLKTKEEKIQFLHTHHLALWDVLESCTIKGASDTSIKDIQVNDIASLLQKTSIEKVLTTGKKAYDLYTRYIEDKTSIPAICLPSTSPANCRLSLEDLVEAYRKAID